MVSISRRKYKKSWKSRKFVWKSGKSYGILRWGICWIDNLINANVEDAVLCEKVL